MKPFASRAPMYTRHTRRASGFTLAEVAVTIVVVGFALVLVLEGMNKAKMFAAHTHNAKIAAELASLTLAEIESGLYWDEIDQMGLDGTYAEEGYETYYWEVIVGDETFPDLQDADPLLEHDTWAYQRERELDQRDEDDEDEEEIEEPYEKVRIRVTFPQFTDQKAEIILERWIPWEQVYGVDEEDEEAAAATPNGGGGGDR